ncbi:MAG: hypothetical protein JWO47_213 [Candidatus Saccharibacteria bacterium]|nr:hypothetical protein [Candidatus Saccharibacteria bacterium]
MFCYDYLMNTSKKLELGAWGLTVVAVLLAFLAWGQGQKWHIFNLSSYNLFPIFGLTAFSIMWAHYIVAALRTRLKADKEVTKSYFELTSLVVLGCILLHPGILIVQLFRDGAGLPPESYLHYVQPGLKWAVLLGSLSLTVFIGYEFYRIYDKKPWWKYVQYASDVAMFLIVIHALALGDQLGPGWYRIVWVFYAASLLAAVKYMYSKKLKNLLKKT